jgi:hypothetical protein
MAKRRGRSRGGFRRGRRARRGSSKASHSVVLVALGLGTALIPFVAVPSGGNASAINYLMSGNLGMAAWSLATFVMNNWTIMIGPIIVLLLAAVALKHLHVRLSKHWRV